MSFVLRNNGQFVALVLAAACASFITYTVLGYDSEDFVSTRTLVLAALSAVVATWLFWQILVARGTRILALRGGFAGAFAGLFAHPLFIFAGTMAEAIDACPEIACVYTDVLTAEMMNMMMFNTAFVTTFGVLFVGPLTMLVGILGGVLAVVIAGFGKPRKQTEPPEPDDAGPVPPQRLDTALSRGGPFDD